MEDRLVEYPNRVRLIPVEGQDGVYDIVQMPGTVTSEGTPLNKLTLLSDNVAELLDNPATPSEALGRLAERLQEADNAFYDLRGGNQLAPLTDLNTLFTIGNYWATFVDVDNAPPEGGGEFMLKVSGPRNRGGGYIMQEAVFIDSLNTYRRIYDASSRAWGDWLLQSHRGNDFSSRTAVISGVVAGVSSGNGSLYVDYPDGFTAFNTYVLSVLKRRDGSQFWSSENYPGSAGSITGGSVQVILRDGAIEIKTIEDRGNEIAPQTYNIVFRILLYRVDMAG